MSKNYSQFVALIVVIVVALTAVLVAAAQDDGGETSGDEEAFLFPYEPVETILEGPLEITGFANDGTATLPIVTTIPVACTIVYGTTTEFGSLTLDQDMEGGTHSDHSPLLTGLEPETTYYFRVQGVDDSGTIYLSDIMTFTTPAFEEEENNNLASPENGAEVIGYSSAFGGAEPDARWGVNSAFDNSQNTEWSSAGDGDDAWVEVQLAEASQIDLLTYTSRVMTDGTSRVISFTVTTDSGEVYGPFEVPEGQQLSEFEVDFVAETLRFDVEESTGGNTGAVDIGVFGGPVE